MISDGESIKKMLRSVLQSSKEGVAVSCLQAEFRSLCGDFIPLKALGFSRLEDYLRSIPSVVRLDYRMGEFRCFAAVCKETAHIAELVAKQKSSKKSGQSQLVNCKMRFKRSDPYMLNAASRFSLRQPSAAPYWTTRRFPTQGSYQSVCGGSGAGVGRSQKSCADQWTVAETPPPPASRPSLAEPGVYSVQQLQARLGELLQKYPFGLWMSKLSQLYGEMFAQQLHPQALAELDTWTHVCMVEKPSSGRSDRLIYPPLPSSAPPTPPPTPTSSVASPAPLQVPKPQVAPHSPLAGLKPSSPRQPTAAPPGGPLSPAPACEKTAAALDHRGRCHPPAANTAPSQAPPVQAHQDIWPRLKAGPAPPNPEEQESRLKVRDLLVKYSHGLWAPALPKLFSDTYKVTFPQHLLDNLTLLMDFCRVEYPMPHDKHKAILYYCNSGAAAAAAAAHPQASDAQTDGRCRGPSIPSGVALVSPVTPSPLVVPLDQYPSVLVTETQGSGAVTIRYVGENYSSAQEAMEENMRCFYSQGSAHLLLSRPVIGQLVAIRTEQGEELARAQVVELLVPDGVKVYYVDYGFSAVTSVTSLLELHQDFLSLPFQATNVQLAGLEVFSSHPALQASLDELAAGKILLMETLEVLQPSGPPAVVLYDTSQEKDVNINAACLTALQGKTMNDLLTVGVTYEGVCVTNVSSEGVVYCQLPSRGASRLRKCLEDTEAIFSAQVTSDSLLSRPFTGQLCLARHQGSWSRAQISNTFGSRVMEILFIDLGVQATVEVTDLREIPPPVIQDLVVIPPLATKCRLVELPVPEGDWTPEAVQMVEEALLDSENCKMKIVKLEQHKDECVVHIYLFIGTDSQDLDQSVNRQLAQSHLWNQASTPERNVGEAKGPSGEKLGPDPDQAVTSTSTRPPDGADPPGGSSVPEVRRLPLPPPLELPRAGLNLDVFVPVACHPGHFVLQQWQELHKLMVLMGEMMLYYNRTWKMNRAPAVHKGEVYAAKIEKNWRRVQAKVVLANGFVSAYELDHGRHELVHCSHFQLLIEEFRQLPFQAIAAQLAGVTHHQWSEEASMLFRNHVEDRALVAKVESVQECSEVQGETWERRWTVFLVDTTQEDRDLWVHSVMADIGGELSSTA